MLFLFDDYALDTDRRELLEGGSPIALQPQVFDVLAFLISNRGRVVARTNHRRCLGGAGRLGIDADQPHQCGAERGRRQWRRATPHPDCVPQRLSLYWRCPGNPFERGAYAAAANGRLALAAPLTPDSKPSAPVDFVLPFANLGGNPDHDPSSMG